MIVAIDGPAGSGKSTLARMVASEFDMTFLDTGALYRAYGLACLRAGADLDDAEAVGRACSEADVDIVYDGTSVSLAGEDLSEAIRTPAADDAASRVSRFPVVRDLVNERLRAVASVTDVVSEGRDMGSVVFPDAEAKLFLVADVRIRAERRLIQRGIEASPDEIAAEVARLEERDARDSGRDLAPLVRADDACVVDMGVVSLDAALSAVSMMLGAAR